MTEPEPIQPSPQPSPGAGGGPPGAPETHFFELGGAAAAARLRALAATLPGDVDGELLSSRDQPDLHLLVCRGGAAALATIVPPDGARRWRFGAAAAGRRAR